MKRYVPIACLALSACATNDFEGIGKDYPQGCYENCSGGPPPETSWGGFNI